MKKNYTEPRLCAVMFSENILTEPSGTDGVDLTEERLRQMKIEHIQKETLSSFTFVL